MKKKFNAIYMENDNRARKDSPLLDNTIKLNIDEQNQKQIYCWSHVTSKFCLNSFQMYYGLMMNDE